MRVTERSLSGRRGALLAGAGLLCFAATVPAMAQTAGTPATAAAEPSGATSVQTGPSEDLGTLTDIVVTAQRRAENLQKIPLSITAIDTSPLIKQGGGNLLAVQGLVPNVEINASNAATGIAIRGIFSTNDSAQGDPAVAYHVDGVYLGRPQSVGGLFYDVDRVEVLRGPQGTLYGRNATAGAVNVITAKPVFELRGSAAEEFGNYDLYGFSGMLNVPIGDVLAARVAFRSQKRDGFATDGRTDDYDDRAARGHLLYKPTSNFSVLLSADYDLRKGVGTAAYRLNVPNVDPRSTILANPGAHIRNQNWGVRGEMNWSFGGVTLTLLPAYHYLDLDNLYASDRRIQLYQKARQTSVEARLASDGSGPLTWIVGAFYWQELQTYQQTLLAPPTQVRFGYDYINSFSKALFGQATYALTDRLRLTGGLRYTSDHKEQSGATVVSLPNGVVLSNVANRANDEWHAVNWKASGEFDLAEHSLLYATASTGYKAGGNYDGLPPNSYQPERIFSLEVGSKNRLLDNKLQVNLSAFRYRYSNYQASQLGCLNLPAGIPVCTASGRITYNADKATVYGVELESQYAVTAADRLGLTAAYTRSKFNDFVLPVTRYASGGNFSGNPLPKSPRFTVTGEYSHRFALGPAGDLTFTGRVRHVSEQFLLFDLSNPTTRQGGYEMGDLSLAYQAPGDRWELSGYVNNIGDVLVKSYAFATSTPGVYYGTYLPPRTYGLRLAFNF